MPYHAMIVSPDEFRRVLEHEEITLEADSLAGKISQMGTALVLESLGGKDDSALTGRYAICAVMDAKVDKPPPHNVSSFHWIIKLSEAIRIGSFG